MAVVPLHTDFANAYDGYFEENMTVCVESLIGEEGGRECVKLETQVLITAHGAKRLDSFPVGRGLRTAGHFSRARRLLSDIRLKGVRGRLASMNFQVFPLIGGRSRRFCRGAVAMVCAASEMPRFARAGQAHSTSRYAETSYEQFPLRGADLHYAGRGRAHRGRGRP